MKHTIGTLSLLFAVLFLFCFTAGCNTSKEPSGSPPDSSSPTPHSPVLKEIEITSDNWSTYFEFVEKEEEYKNEYNETEHIQHYYSFVLKEAYVMADTGTKIAMEYSFNEINHHIQEDLVNKKIVWGEPFEEGVKTVSEEVTITRSETKVAGERFMIDAEIKSKCSDFKVLRIYGTLVFYINPSEPSEDPTPTFSPNITQEPTATPTPTLTPSPVPTVTPTAKPTAQITAKPTAKPTQKPTETPKPTVVQRADPETGISWDGKSAIIYTYTDGTTGTIPKPGATYEQLPGRFNTIPQNTTPSVYDGTCSKCGKKEGDGTNGTCLRYWAGGDHICENCGDVVPVKTCHTCSEPTQKPTVTPTPVLYICRDCGKPDGDGTNGTCVQWLLKDVDCPNCGVHVQVRTCHTCE